jgi:hypothetical protein
VWACLLKDLRSTDDLSMGWGRAPILGTPS